MTYQEWQFMNRMQNDPGRFNQFPNLTTPPAGSPMMNNLVDQFYKDIPGEFPTPPGFANPGPNIQMQFPGDTDPGIEPPPLPSPTPGFNFPHEAMDVPPGVFPQASIFDVGSPRLMTDVYIPGQESIGPGTFNESYPLPTNQLPTNEVMNPADLGYFPQDQPGDFSNQNFPAAPDGSTDQFTGIELLPQDMYDEIYGGQPAGVVADPGNVGNPAITAGADQGIPFGINSGEFQGITPMPPDIYQQVWGWEDQPNVADDTGGSAPGGVTYDELGNQIADTPVAAPYQTPVTGANDLLGYNPYSYGPPSGPNGPVVQGSQGVPDGHGGFVPGTQLSQADEAKRYNMQQFNDPRYTWHDALHPGQAMVKIMSDGTRVLVDATGKAIGAGIQAGQDLYHNIMNDPRNTTPADLAAAGYKEGQGTGSLFPGSVTGPTAGPFDVGAYGVGGEGGSFFHGDTLNSNLRVDPNTGQPIFDRGPSTMNPGGYNFPTHGATSVAGASAGGMGPITNANALGARSGALSPLDRQYLMRLMRGNYTTSGNYVKNVENAPSPFAGKPSPLSGGNWNAFHAGQVQLGDILRANPAYYQSLTTAMPKTGQGPSTPGSRLTRGTPPTLPT